MKYYLQKNDEILQAMRDPTPLIQSAFDCIPPEQCQRWICHSGVYQSTAQVLTLNYR